MNPISKTFATLLTEGIYRISLSEGNKPVRVIQDELGFALGREGGSPIEYWRKGHIPAQCSDIQGLAREVTRRSSLGRDWLEKFLLSADFPNPALLCDQFFPIPHQADTHQSSACPHKLYRQLIGRDNLIQNLMERLRDEESKPILTIDGMGGIGKTALTRELVECCNMERLFNSIVWVDASALSMEVNRHESNLLDQMMNQISQTLGISDVSRLSAAEKQSRVKTLLKQYKLLIVLDNLEVLTAQTGLLDQIRLLLGVSRSILVSRKRFSGDCISVHLTGLSKVESIQLLRQEARERGILRVETADNSELEEIAVSTGGSPLAMKLVVGQLAHLPLPTVLQHLKEARPLNSKAAEDDFISFYKFIYMPSWNLLKEEAQNLLISMANFASEIGGTIDDLKIVSGMGEDVVLSEIDELWRLSLVEIEDSTSASLSQVSYYLHALTRYFVLSDILQMIK